MRLQVSTSLPTWDLIWENIRCIGLYYSMQFSKPQCNKWKLNFPKYKAKKINCMSQSCRAHLFFGACLIQQNPKFEFFLFAWFFFQFFMTCLSKNIRKGMTDTMKHYEQQTSSTLVFCLVSCSSKIKFHISKLWPTQIWHVCCSEKKKKKNVKKNAFRSGLPICHELWDITFIFFSLSYFAFSRSTTSIHDLQILNTPSKLLPNRI